MTFFGHLEELRSRILWSLWAWVLASGVCYYFVPKLLVVVRQEFLDAKIQLIFTHPTEAFFAYLKVAMVAGIFVASPVLGYHLLMFVVPGLEQHERRWLFRLMPFSILLFVAGCTFAFYVVLPITMHFFVSFSNEALTPMFTVGEFLGFVTGVLLLCGVAFQVPLVLFLAAQLGLISSKMLRQHRRIAIFISFLIAAVATPTPDAFTMSVVAVPIWLLFEISVVLIRITGK